MWRNLSVGESIPLISLCWRSKCSFPVPMHCGYVIHMWRSMPALDILEVQGTSIYIVTAKDCYARINDLSAFYPQSTFSSYLDSISEAQLKTWIWMSCTFVSKCFKLLCTFQSNPIWTFIQQLTPLNDRLHWKPLTSARL